MSITGTFNEIGHGVVTALATLVLQLIRLQLTLYLWG